MQLHFIIDHISTLDFLKKKQKHRGMVRFAYTGRERDKQNLEDSFLTTFDHDTAAQER